MHESRESIALSIRGLYIQYSNNRVHLDFGNFKIYYIM
jgi:hypothetical protein